MSTAEYIAHMGDDLMVVNAARVSFNKQSEEFTLRADKPKGSDEGLIQYLASHGHWTPFSHPVVSMLETVPIFVARQRFKHMVGFTYNEVSRRYVDDAAEFFQPTSWRARPDASIKQGSADDLPPAIAEKMQKLHDSVNSQAEAAYIEALSNGVAPEQARMMLPQSMMTSYWVTGSLYAWSRAYKQRIDSHSQVEIQELAQQWGEIIQPLFPHSWAALT